METSVHVAQCTFVINPQQMSDISLHFSSWHGDFSSRVFLQTKCFHAKQDPFGNKLATLMSRLSGFPSWPPQCYFVLWCSFVRFKVKSLLPLLSQQPPNTCTPVFRESTHAASFISGLQENQTSLHQHKIWKRKEEELFRSTDTRIGWEFDQ